MRQFGRALMTMRRDAAKDLRRAWHGGWRSRWILLGAAMLIALIWLMPAKL